MEHLPFQNQDIIDKLTVGECQELSNIKEIRRSLTAAIDYLEIREIVIFAAARARISKQGGIEL